MRFAGSACILILAACGATETKPEPPSRPIVVATASPPDAGTEEMGPSARDVSLVTKSPRKSDSCWKDHECSGGRVCVGPDPDPTVGGCPVPGCRERAFAGTCASNRDCYTGYGCVLGKSEFAGPSDVWHCEKIRCTADADCFSRNLRCQSGECLPIPCTRDSQCDGYCMGTCSAKPGTCVVPHPREMRP